MRVNIESLEKRVMKLEVRVEDIKKGGERGRKKLIVTRDGMGEWCR